MKYELKIISDVVSNNPNPNIKPKVLVKDDRIKKLFDLFEIKLEEYVDPKTGRHIKKYCTVIEENTFYKIDKPYEELKSIIQNKSIPVLGLAAKSKRFKTIKAEQEDELPEYLEDKSDETEVYHYIEGTKVHGHNTKKHKGRKVQPSKRSGGNRRKTNRT